MRSSEATNRAGFASTVYISTVREFVVCNMLFYHVLFGKSLLYVKGSLDMSRWAKAFERQ